MKTLELEAPPGVCTILLDDDSCEETAPAPALRNSSQEKKIIKSYKKEKTMPATETPQMQGS